MAAKLHVTWEKKQKDVTLLLDKTARIRSKPHPKAYSQPTATIKPSLRVIAMTSAAIYAETLRQRSHGRRLVGWHLCPKRNRPYHLTQQCANLKRILAHACATCIYFGRGTRFIDISYAYMFIYVLPLFLSLETQLDTVYLRVHGCLYAPTSESFNS